MPVSVFLVSDSTIFLSAMEQAIRADFSRISRCASLTQVMNLVVDWQDTVAIVDAGNPNDVVAQLSVASHCVDATRIIVLMRSNQSFEDYRPIISMIGALLPDGATLQEIALAARIIRHGITLLPTAAISAFLPEASNACSSGTYYDVRSFTDREHAVLSLISRGASNKIIALELDIAESTVRVHVRAILRKLGMQNRTQAALYAVGQKGSKIGLDLFRPTASMVSGFFASLMLDLKTLFPETTANLLIEAAYML